MPKATHVVYTDDNGKEVLRQIKSNKFEMVGIYGNVDAAEAKRLHAALGELLTDLAAEEKAKEPAVV